jgi:hypothetical protein
MCIGIVVLCLFSAVGSEHKASQLSVAFGSSEAESNSLSIGKFVGVGHSD